MDNRLRELEKIDFFQNLDARHEISLTRKTHEMDVDEYIREKIMPLKDRFAYLLEVGKKCLSLGMDGFSLKNKCFAPIRIKEIIIATDLNGQVRESFDICWEKADFCTNGIEHNVGFIINNDNEIIGIGMDMSGYHGCEDHIRTRFESEKFIIEGIYCHSNDGSKTREPSRSLAYGATIVKPKIHNLRTFHKRFLVFEKAFLMFVDYMIKHNTTKRSA